MEPVSDTASSFCSGDKSSAETTGFELAVGDLRKWCLVIIHYGAAHTYNLCCHIVGNSYQNNYVIVLGRTKIYFSYSCSSDHPLPLCWLQ